MKRLLREEGGWALVTAVVLAAIMVGIGLASFAVVDTQQNQARGQRESESAFNYAESVLNAQVFVLGRAWPGDVVGAYPLRCPDAADPERCPDAADLGATFTSVDYASGASWQVEVRDNDLARPDFYDEAAFRASRTTWDANADGKVWVRARTTVRRRTRAIVALAQVEQVSEDLRFPRHVLIAGRFKTGNSGNKTIVATLGRPLSVRCDAPAEARLPDGTAAMPPNDCLDFALVRRGQVSPDTASDNYAGGAALPSDSIDRLRARAKADGTYYATGCPTGAGYAGAVVFVEAPGGTCLISDTNARAACTIEGKNEKCINTPSTPGVLVFATGAVQFRGNIVFSGVVYAPNFNNASTTVVDIGGNARVHGAVFVDGPGGVVTGETSLNLAYTDSSFSNLRSYGSAKILQNTWREIVPSAGSGG